MLFFQIALALVLNWLFLKQVSAIIVTQEDPKNALLATYDYIVVGGGLSGLVVGNRLSANPNVTVLVLEAGELDNRTEYTTYPAHIGRDITSNNDWTLQTTRQEYLDNKVRPYFQGRSVGGGTIIHGMVWTRGSWRDFDTWRDLGNPGWSWDDLLPYFMKSEKYSMNLEESMARELGVDSAMSLHGTSGPVEVSFPRFVYNHTHAILDGYEELGIPRLGDMNTGRTTGVVFSPSSMNATNQSRCDARAAYLDPVVDRPNMHVAIGRIVTRLLLSDAHEAPTESALPLPKKLVEEVEFATIQWTNTNLEHAVRSRVAASREVIMASGAVFTPTILQVSGIGPRSVLETVNITVQIDLPGVGNNFQDHGMVGTLYNYTNPERFTADNLEGRNLLEAELLYRTNRTGPLTAPMISVVAFPSLQALTPEWNTLTGGYMLEDFDQYLPPDTPPEVRRGYAKQCRLQLGNLRQDDEPATEIMTDSVGRYTVAIQSTMSRGTIRPSGPDILRDGKPLINPRFCAHPLDCDVALLSFRMNARLMKTRSMSKTLAPSPREPFASADDDSDQENTLMLVDFIKRGLGTEFHPSGTTAMLPLEDGGVVDTALRVYGTANLRVVDAGIMPLLPAAHIQAGVYAVAEKAADLIKEDWP